MSWKAELLLIHRSAVSTIQYKKERKKQHCHRQFCYEYQYRVFNVSAGENSLVQLYVSYSLICCIFISINCTLNTHFPYPPLMAYSLFDSKTFWRFKQIKQRWKLAITVLWGYQYCHDLQAHIIFIFIRKTFIYFCLQISACTYTYIWRLHLSERHVIFPLECFHIPLAGIRARRAHGLLWSSQGEEISRRVQWRELCLERSCRSWWENA